MNDDLFGYAAEKMEEIQNWRRPGSPRTRRARQVVNKYTMSNTVVSGTVGKVPYLDAPLLAANEVKMVKEINEIYGIKDDNNAYKTGGVGTATGIIGANAGTIIDTATDYIGETILSQVKEVVGTIPGVGSCSKPVIAGCVTKSLGEDAINRARFNANKRG